MSEVKGTWKGKKAGGCFNHATWRFCPQYSFKLDKKAKVAFELSQENEHSAGFYVLKSDGTGRRVIFDEEVVTKSGFKAKKMITHEAEMASGEYIVVVATFEPGKEGDFVLKSSHGTLKRLRKSKDWHDSTVKGEWKGKSAGGCKDHKSFKYNPQFLFNVAEKQEAIIALYQSQHDDFDNIGYYIVKTEELKPVEKVLSTNIVGKGAFADGNESVEKFELDAGNYSLVPCTFTPEKEASFGLTIFSAQGIRFQDDAAGAGGDDDEDAGPQTPSTPHSASAPAAASSAAAPAVATAENTVEIALVREKKAHLDTLNKVASLQTELDQLRESNHRLQDQVKAIHSGSGKATDSAAAVVDPVMMTALMSDLAAADSEKSKTAIMDKIRRLLNPNQGSTSPAPGEEGAVVEFSKDTVLTTKPQTGKTVALFGEWAGPSAGGCMNHLTWRYNPQVFLTVKEETKMTITLTQQITVEKPKPSSISFYIIRPDISNGKRIMMLADPENDVIAKCKFMTAMSVSMEISVPAHPQPYIIIPCTYEPNHERRFTLSVSSDVAVNLAPFDPEVHEWNNATVYGEWTKETAGGCKNHSSFTTNPQYLLTVEKKTTVNILMLQKDKEEFDAINAYLVKIPEGRTGNTKLPKVSNDEVVEKGKFGDPQENCFSAVVQPGKYAIIPCTFDPAHEAKFTLHVFAANAGSLTLTELTDGAEVAIQGDWTAETAGGCLNDESSFRKNIQYKLDVKKDMTLQIRLRQVQDSELCSAGFYILKGSDKPRLRIASKDIIYKSAFTKTKDVILEVNLHMGASPYIIVPCTFTAGERGSYKLSLFAKDGDPSFVESVALTKMPDSYVGLVAKGQWDDVHAGGCLNHTTWINNPQYQLTTDKKCELVVFLSVPENQETFTTSIGFYIAKSEVDAVLLELTSKDIIKKASFRKGTEVAVKAVVEPGTYNIIASTFKPGFKSAFTLTVFSDNKGGTKLTSLSGGDITVRGKWDENSAGGSTNDMTSWLRNPRFYLSVRKPLRLGAVLVQSPGKQFEDEQFQPIGFLITKSDGEGNPRTTKETDLIARAGFEPEKDVSTVFDIDPSVDPYCIIPSTFDPDVKLSFQLTVLVDPQSREFVELLDAPPTVSKAEWEDQFKAEAIISKMQKAINTAATSTSDLVNLVDMAELDALALPVRDLQNSVSKFQKLLNALKAAQLMGEEDIVVPKDLLASAHAQAAAANPNFVPLAPPPPTSYLTTEERDKPVKGTTYDHDEAESELLMILKAGRAQLKSAADRKLAPKPVEKDPFCAFNMDKIMSRRAAIEGEDEEEDNDEDWDD